MPITPNSQIIFNRHKSIYTSFLPPYPYPSHHSPLSKPHFLFFNFKLLFLIISMASSFCLLLYSLLFLSLSPPSFSRHSDSKASHHTPSSPVSAAIPAVQLACRATRYPDSCQSMLSDSFSSSSLPPSPQALISAAFSAADKNLNAGQDMVKDILAGSARDQNRSRAAQTCLEVLSMSQHRASAAVDAVACGKLRDARAWASAALSYQYDCWSGLKYVNDSSAVNSTMSFFDTTLIVSTSNALSMLRALDALGPDTRAWTPPRTERDGFWEPIVGSADVRPGFDFAGLVPDVTVSKDGSEGGYTTVQAAVDAAPENLQGGKRFVIKIKEGVYDEIVRVGFNKTNLVFLGDGMGIAVITGSLNTGIMGITTYNTATVGIMGDGFLMSGLTIQNTAGPDAHQAVAFRSDSDFSYIENCEFLGNQDTVYVHSLRQLFKSCRIEGNVDFIFGNAAAIFQDCTILVRPRQLNPEKGETNAIAAHGRTDPAQTTGFAFLGCLINGTDDYMKFYYSKPSKHRNYLGRPWKMYSRTVYVNCTMESLITPEGWLPWSGDFALSTLYYGEFGNSGPGANVSSRVPWSRQIPEQHVSTYYVQNFLQGDEWITTTCQV